MLENCKFFFLNKIKILLNEKQMKLYLNYKLN